MKQVNVDENRWLFVNEGSEVANLFFMAISFLALSVIAEFKLTHKGLVDVTQFKIVPLFEDG